MHHCPIYCEKDQSRLRGQLNVATANVKGFTGERVPENPAYSRRLQRYHYAKAQSANCEAHLADAKQENGALKPSQGKRVRFDERQVHRRETQYRYQAFFDTTSSVYTPGAYADTAASEGVQNQDEYKKSRCVKQR